MSEFRDTLRVEGVKARGYGIVPKMVMLDRKLTIEAKAIYSYFCSYAGAGDTAFPSRDKICEDLCIGIKRYYNHFNLLIEYGYITVKQIRNGGGQFKHNIYTLMDKPEVKSIDKSNSGPVDNSVDSPVGNKETPSSHNDHTAETEENSGVEPCDRKGYADEGYTDNDHTNINSPSYNQQSSILLSVSQSGTDMTELQTQIENQAEVHLYPTNESELLTSAIRRLLHTDELKVNNRTIDNNQIAIQLSRLKLDICDLALNKYKDAMLSGNKINNKLQYFCIVLYNSIDEYYAENFNPYK